MQAHSQQTCLADTVPQSHADTISNDQGSQKGTLFKLPSKTLPPCNNTDSCNPDQRQPKKSTLYIHSALQFTLQLWKPDWSSNESTCWTHFFLCNRKPDWSSNESICWIHFVLCNRKPNWSRNETICSVQQKARLVQQWEYLLNSRCSVQQSSCSGRAGQRRRAQPAVHTDALLCAVFPGRAGFSTCCQVNPEFHYWGQLWCSANLSRTFK